MKTINKVLLGILAVIMIIIAVAFILFQRKINSGILPDKQVFSEEVRKISQFNKLAVKDGITVYYNNGSSPKLRVRAGKNLIGFVRTEITGNELNIFLSQPQIVRNDIIAYISNDSINEVRLESGAMFKTVIPLISSTLRLYLSAGSEADIQGVFRNLFMTLSSGSNSKLKGECINFECNSNSGSELNAGNFKVKKCHLEAESGSNLKVNVLDKFSVSATSGSSIVYSGNPEMKEINLTGGANLKKE